MSEIISKTIQFPPLTKSKFNFLKLPHIKINSVDEYFSLPKKEREKFGFYLLPLSLPFTFFNRDNKTKGWKDFYAQLKKEYPVQYFFRHWLVSYENPVYSFVNSKILWPLKDLKWKIVRHFNPCYPRWREVLPKHKYIDIVELVVESNFALIRDFYYEEVEKGFVDWKADDKHKKFHKELLNAIKWIETERKLHLDKADDALSHATKTPIEKKGKFDYKATYKTYNKLEEELKNKDTKILTWFIENREFFWT
jgi:hypothetical protein